MVCLALHTGSSLFCMADGGSETKTQIRPGHFPNEEAELNGHCSCGVTGGQRGCHFPGVTTSHCTLGPRGAGTLVLCCPVTQVLGAGSQVGESSSRSQAAEGPEFQGPLGPDRQVSVSP